MTAKNSSSSHASAPSTTEMGAKTGSNKMKKRVLVIGAGCSGFSAAYALSLSPDKFDVRVYDKAPSVGGSATSFQLPSDKDFGAQYINDGVQGASPVFFNTFKMFEEVLGFKASDVGMQISFGKGKDTFWSNVFPTELIDEFKDDIKKFGTTLQTIKTFEPIFALIPVDRMLKMFRFSPSFGERIVYPLVALFFGTGNETKHISSAILERVFLDPSMRLFEYSEESFLASVPHMKAFPELARVYGEWKKLVSKNGNVVVESNCEVTSIERGTKTAKEMGGNILAVIKGDRKEIFDEVIFACDADSTLKILSAGSGPTWKERKILGNVLYKWDVTVTHHDYDYMCKHYQMTYDDQYNAKRDDEESKKAFEFAKENWKPLYLIKMYEDEPSMIEMSFDLTHYQGQFEGMPAVGKDARVKISEALPTQRVKGEGGKELISEQEANSGLNVEEKSGGGANAKGTSPPVENHVYQTIYLDKNVSEKWTKDEVSKDKVILEKWWKQQSHRWQHYGGTVPWMWSINGKNHTQFAGAWTLVNMHEVGIVSGFSAAYQLGAPYPFKDDEECARLFRLYLLLAHMSRMRGEDRKGFFS